MVVIKMIFMMEEMELGLDQTMLEAHIPLKF